MLRRILRGARLPAIVLAVLALRAAGCRKKPAGPAHAPVVTPIAKHWITPLLTPPPPAPTPTLWKGVTRVPQLPE